MSSTQKISEAIDILQSVGLPKAQLNERSGLCLLALLELKPDSSWMDVENPLMGITPIMDWVKEVYDKPYAPNSRETFRRQTMHQFREAGMVVQNPDQPDRPVNSPKAVYQIDESFKELIRTYGTPEWDLALDQYLSNLQTLVAKYARSREQVLVPVQIPGGGILKLSSGDHSELMKSIVEDFRARFAAGSKLLYMGDTASKNGFYDKATFEGLGLDLDNHGKMPDVVLYLEDKNWLYLVESVTSHGPVDGKRYAELEDLFGDSSAELVYVTALPSRTFLARFLPVIAWETEVWVADAPSHLIHFNGDKFMGPHK